MPADHQPVTGREPILRFWQGMVDNGLSEVTLQATGIECARRAAYVVGRYALTVTPAAAVPLIEAGICLIAFRRQPDGSWKAVEHTFHSD